MTIRFAVITLAVVAILAPGATACTSSTSGDWHTSSIWTACSNGVPTSSKTVTISAGTVVTIASNGTANSLILSGELAQIDFDGGASSVSGPNKLTIANIDGAAGVRIGGGGTSKLNFEDADIAALADGFASIQFGDTGDTGTISLSTATFTDPISLISDTISGGSLDAGTHAITVTGRLISHTTTFTGDLTVNGEVSVAGSDTSGTLTIDGDLTLSSSDSVTLDVNTSSDRDQLAVSGAVTLGSAGLSVVTGGSVSEGDVFIVVAVDGASAVSGSFSGLAEGGNFTAGGHYFVISYSGGDGNDISLTVQCGTDDSLCTIGESCISADCAPLSSTGGDCDSGEDHDCASGHACVSSTCLLDDGGTCTSATACASGICDAATGSCITCGPDATASGTTACVCNSGFYSDDGGAHGDSCSACDPSCAQCDGPTATDCIACQANEALSSGECLLLDGEACTQNAECLDACDTVDGARERTPVRRSPGSRGSRPECVP